MPGCTTCGLGPQKVFVVPGNHDALVPTAWEDGYARWADYMAPDDDAATSGSPTLPSLRVPRPPVALISISTAVPTRPLSAARQHRRRAAARCARCCRTARHQPLPCPADSPTRRCPDAVPPQATDGRRLLSAAPLRRRGAPGSFFTAIPPPVSGRSARAGRAACRCWVYHRPQRAAGTPSTRRPSVSSRSARSHRAGPPPIRDHTYDHACGPLSEPEIPYKEPARSRANPPQKALRGGFNATTRMTLTGARGREEGGGRDQSRFPAIWLAR